MNNPEGVQFLDAETRLRFENDHMVRKLTQEVPDSFLDGLRSERDASTAPAGNFHRVASIPVAIVEKWMAEGFNIFDKNVTVKEIVRRLHREDMTAFMATKKRI